MWYKGFMASPKTPRGSGSPPPLRWPGQGPAAAQAKPAAGPPALVWPGRTAPAAQPKAAGPAAPPVVWPGRPPAAQPKAATPARTLAPPPRPVTPPRPAPLVHRVVQPVLEFKSGDTENDISSVRAALLEIHHSASERAIEALRLEAKSKYTTYYKDWADAVSKAEASTRLERLKRTNTRNRRRKARPKRERALFSSQQEHNYGYDNTVIREGFAKGSFRRGYGFQPFLSLKKEDYENAVVASDYDALIAVIEVDEDHSQPEIAEDILAFIDHKTEPQGYSAKTLRAMATLILLTQYIEPHDRRITGADKWGRACFSNILNSGSSFRREFNRKNGNYLPARAKKAGSKYGGQESSRGLLGLPKKKTDKVKFSEVFSERVLEPLRELSDSSDDEDDKLVLSDF